MTVTTSLLCSFLSSVTVRVNSYVPTSRPVTVATAPSAFSIFTSAGPLTEGQMDRKEDKLMRKDGLTSMTLQQKSILHLNEYVSVIPPMQATCKISCISVSDSLSLFPVERGYLLVIAALTAIQRGSINRQRQLFLRSSIRYWWLIVFWMMGRQK